jgi:relaxase-like protein
VSRRDFVGTSYAGPRSRGRSAARLARYMEDRRREDGRYEKARTYGDRAAFVEAAKERAEAGRRASYVHAVISPERGPELEDKDFERLIGPWTRDRQGRECPYFAAIHRDTEHAHIHIAVARDKFQKAELERLKERARELIASRQRLRAESWYERGREREERMVRLELGREQGRGREGRERESEKEHELER